MCSFEWIGLHFKAIFRRLSGFERPENSPVESFQWFERPEICPVESFQWFERPEICPVDRFQRERVGRPPSNGPVGPGAKSREINAEMQTKTP